MNLFEWFLTAHCVGDYLLQTEFEALNKAVGRFANRALISHCLKYTICFTPVFWFFSVHPAWLLLIFASHCVVDRRWPVVLWRKYINRNSHESIAKTFWLTIMIDQIFHAIILVPIVVLR